MSTTSCLDNNEKKCLFEKVSSLLGDKVGVEIPPKTWCSLLELSVNDFMSHMHMWLIKNQWSSLQNKNINTTDICFTLTHTNLDFVSQFSSAISKQQGLQSKGDYELKLDYIDLVEGKQSYLIPKGREINTVLWNTPSEVDMATFASMGNTVGSAGIYGGLNYGGWGTSGGYNGSARAYYVAPAYDIYLRGMDYAIKNRILKSDLTYKITAKKDGTKILHLYSTPNHANRIGARNPQYRGRVWYHYYDTEDMDAETKNKCLDECDDIIKFPSDVPINESDYCDLNFWSKNFVRRLLTAYAKEALGRIRGKFKGKIPFPDNEAQLEYETLLAEAKEEKKDVLKELEDYLIDLSPEKQLERKKNELDYTREINSMNPSRIFTI